MTDIPAASSNFASRRPSTANHHSVNGVDPRWKNIDNISEFVPMNGVNTLSTSQMSSPKRNGGIIVKSKSQMSYEPDFVKSYGASKYPGAFFKIHLDTADYVNILPMFKDSEVGAACYNYIMRNAMLRGLRRLLNTTVLLLACDQACSNRGGHLVYSASATVSQLQVVLPDIRCDSDSAIMVPYHRLSNVTE